jgi:hypothetical protein
LGLDGFRVLDAVETPDELVLTSETDAELVALRISAGSDGGE